MITAILLGFLALFLGIIGLRCTSIGSMELSRKAKLAATAGALNILAGNWGKEMGGGGWLPQTFGFLVLISSSPLLALPLFLSTPPSHLARCEPGVAGTPKPRMSIFLTPGQEAELHTIAIP
jgi:hypothetical protein